MAMPVSCKALGGPAGVRRLQVPPDGWKWATPTRCAACNWQARCCRLLGALRPGPLQAVRAAIFDLLTSQNDRHAQNLFINADGSLRLIDNEVGGP